MFRTLFLALGMLAPLPAFAQTTTYTKIGNTTFSSDGTSYTKIGNTTFGSDGSSATHVGSTTVVTTPAATTPSPTKVCTTIGLMTTCY